MNNKEIAMVINKKNIVPIDEDFDLESPDIVPKATISPDPTFKKKILPVAAAVSLTSSLNGLSPLTLTKKPTKDEFKLYTSTNNNPLTNLPNTADSDKLDFSNSLPGTDTNGMFNRSVDADF